MKAQIENIAEMAFSESEKQIENHDKWIEFISPKLYVFSGLKYRHELERFYSEKSKNFINQQRQIFKEKMKFVESIFKN